MKSSSKTLHTFCECCEQFEYQISENLLSNSEGKGDNKENVLISIKPTHVKNVILEQMRKRKL